MDSRYFSRKIVKWYQANKRDLPWRGTRDPYKIWLSEIILQQTRVAQGLPYYERFLQKYPTVTALAAASEQEVLRMWQGLGYYTRARNLHRCAIAVMRNWAGKFPARYEDLLQLPGIGEYTAAAIASFSKREPVAVVDGNVFRVLSRIFGIEDPINSPEGKKRFARVASGLLDHERPDEHNQAMMEFGAMQCVPKSPPCAECIFRRSCIAHNREMVPLLPVKLKARESRKRYFYYMVFEKEGSLMLRKRDEKDIWRGLYDFPMIERSRPASTDKLLQSLSITSPKYQISISASFKHILSHQTIFARFITIRSAKAKIKQQNGASFYTFSEINDLPKPVLVSRFLTERYLL